VVVGPAVTAWTKLGRIEAWFQGEARVSSDTSFYEPVGRECLARFWARCGSRSRPRDDRYQYACLFGAACSTDPLAGGPVCARANSGEMNRHLVDTAAAGAPDHNGVVIPRRGWMASVKGAQDPDQPDHGASAGLQFGTQPD
jgi:hypothetical protein